MKNTKEPFIHITRREGMPLWKGLSSAWQPSSSPSF